LIRVGWSGVRLASESAKGALPTRAGREREVNACLRKALFALLDQDFEQAEDLLSRAVRADSDAIDAYIALARFYRARGEIGRAIRIHQNLLLRGDVAPSERVTVLAELAEDFGAGGFLQRAVASYEEVLAHEPRHPGALEALVDLLSDLRDYPRAIEMARRLAKAQKRKDPAREAMLLVKMAEQAGNEGRAELARRSVKKALRRDPACGAALCLLGQLEADRGRSKAALAAWKKVPRVDPLAAAALYPRLEAVFRGLGRVSDYEAYLRSLLEEQPADRALQLALASHLASRGETDAALALLEGSGDGRPGQLELRVAAGRILLAAGRDDEASKELGRLLDVLEKGPDLLDGESLE
jgi:lipopolysaccharide biosynthesis regulator YciM